MKKLSLLGFTVAFLFTIPLLFILTRNSVNAGQFILILAAVLLLVLWTILYVMLVDPLLRRGVGALLNLQIVWRGQSKSIGWTPVEETGCLLGFFIDMLGYFFIILWLLPFAIAIGLVMWLRR